MRRTPFDGALLIFTITAVTGVWVAYNRTQAGMKFLNVIAAVAIFYWLAGQRRRNVCWLSGLLGGMGSLIAITFLLAHDWQAWPADIGVLTRMGVWWMGVRPPLSLPAIHPNAAGGLIAVLLPFQVAFGYDGWRKRRSDVWSGALILVGVTLVGWLLTSSRAAWLSLAVALGVWLLWVISGWSTAVTGHARQRLFLLLLVLVVVLGIGLSFIVAGGPLSLFGNLPGRDNVTSRLDLFRQTIDLIADFPITGGGLAAFPGLYAQYIAVTPFFQFNYSHNLWLDVALEQTWLGTLALAWLLAGSGRLLWRSISSLRQPDTLFIWATIIGLVVMVLHGAVDDALYGGLGTPLLFFLPGMAVIVAGREESNRLQLAFSFKKQVLVLAGLGMLAGLGLRQTVLATWYANWGAVAMARTELAGWPTRQWDDGHNVAALIPARELCLQAVRIDSHNRTARYRLGLLAMLQRDYETAVTHLEIARSGDPDHRGIVKTLGYSYVWVGELEKAAILLETIPEARRELNVYSGWWEQQGRPDLAAKATEMVLVLDAV